MKDIEAQLIADVTLYSTAQGGRTMPTPAEWFACSCKAARNDVSAWDCRILLSGTPMKPGETRRVEFVFLSGDEAATVFRQASKFYLYEGGRIVGDAAVA